MRLDSGNRSFVLLLTVAVALYVSLAVASCALLTLLLYRLAEDGTAGFDHAWVLGPAGLFLAVNIAGALLGLRSLGSQMASSRRLRRRVAALRARPSPELAAVADSVRLGRRLSVIESPEPFSFAYGAWRPRVVVSRGLLDCASEEELRAVLVHERYHVRNLDPLKVVLARAASATFFLVPVLRALEQRYLAARELAADRRAVRACGRHPLAGALLKVVRGPQWPELAGAAAIGGPELLDVRVAQLESGRGAPERLSRGAVLLSALTVTLLTASFVGAVVGLGGFEPALTRSDTSMHEGGAALAMAAACVAPLAAAGWLTWCWHRA